MFLALKKIKILFLNIDFFDIWFFSLFQLNGEWAFNEFGV